MNMTIRSGVRYALMTCALSALASPMVFAQGAPASNNQNQNQNAATTQLGKVEVTGTRIKRSSVETAQPVTIITAAQIRATGLATVGEVLQNITQAGDSLTPEGQVQSSNNSASTIDLRYLGSSRTLVLVNGKRWTPRLNGSVDLTALPASMIDHVEILQDGASAIYGSDAIAGVVNIITVHNFNGAEAHAYMGMYDNDYGGKSGWDGKTQEYDFTIGTSGSRGGIVVNAQYEENAPVFAENRAQSSPGGGFSQAKYEPGFVPPVLTIQSPQLAGQTFGGATCSKAGVCTMQVAAGPNFNPTTDNFVNRVQNVSYAPTQEGFTKAIQNSSIFFHAHYDLANNLTFTALAAYNTEDSSGQISSRLSGGEGGEAASSSGLPYGIGANNPYNPFGVDLVANKSQYCPNGTELGGVAVASCTPNYLVSTFGESLPGTLAYDRVSRDNIETKTFRMGFNGFFDAIGSEWDWDLGYNYGRTYDTARDTGFSDHSRLASQLDSPGVLPCNGPAQSAPGSTGTWQEINGKYFEILLPGCVPVNPFGGYNSVTGESAITPEMIAYNQVGPQFITSVTMRDYTGNITGQLVQLPAGPLSVAAGLEYLEQDGFESPSALLERCDLTLRCIQPTAGRTWTNAEYVEFNVPLLTDVPLAKSLSIDLANRWSQFSWQGGTSGTPGAGVKNRDHATTARAQIRWQPVTSLLLRGSWAQGFRAPSINDLYNSGGFSYNTLQDPCAPAAANGGWVAGTPLPSGCDGVVHVQNSAQIRRVVGGNPGLAPETSISRSAGFVYSPDWLPGLNFGADYYHIDIGKNIGTVPAQYVLDQCYIDSNPQYCSLIKLTGGNTIYQINNLDVNVGEAYTTGVDVNANYVFPETPVGSFRISTNWTFVRSFVTVVPDSQSPTGFESIEQSGFPQIPKRRGQVNLHWNFGNWSAVWNIQYIGKTFERCSATTIRLNQCSRPNSFDENTQTMGENQLGTTIYHDASVTYHVEPINTDFTFGIRNLFNKQYPVAHTARFPANSESSMGYRIPGRFFYARVGVKF